VKSAQFVIALCVCLPLCAAAQNTEVATHASPETTAPRIVSKTEPKYSEQARSADIQGRVVLQLKVGVDGFAHNIQVIRTLGSLDQRAIEAVRLWRFQPATEDGHAVTVSASVEVEFRLGEQIESESAFHRFARHEFEQAIESINFNTALRQKYVNGTGQHPKDGTLDPVKTEMEKISAATRTASEQLAVLEYRMAHADDCARVYQEMFGKTALTVTEAAAVQVCRSADMYPPKR
jgi:TonB family protein